MSDKDDNPKTARLKTGQPCSATRTHPSDPKLDKDAQDRIGRDLRAMYQALLLESLPDRLVELTSRLRSTPQRSLQ